MPLNKKTIGVGALFSCDTTVANQNRKQKPRAELSKLSSLSFPETVVAKVPAMTRPSAPSPTDIAPTLLVLRVLFFR